MESDANTVRYMHKSRGGRAEEMSQDGQEGCLDTVSAPRRMAGGASSWCAYPAVTTNPKVPSPFPTSHYTRRPMQRSVAFVVVLSSPLFL